MQPSKSLTVLLSKPFNNLPWLKQSSVHFSPKKSLSTTITYSGKTQNIIKNTTATEKEELKLKKQDTYYKVSDTDQVD